MTYVPPTVASMLIGGILSGLFWLAIPAAVFTYWLLAAGRALAGRWGLWTAAAGCTGVPLVPTILMAGFYARSYWLAILDGRPLNPPNGDFYIGFALLGWAIAALLGVALGLRLGWQTQMLRLDPDV
ncbi:hypothetical protein [Sphingomonas sp.]|uniref:hypothetical protein n=1 Tax=Sphingomonas sp. TaxID=28214 RepID=UPI003B3AC695